VPLDIRRTHRLWLCGWGWMQCAQAVRWGRRRRRRRLRQVMRHGTSPDVLPHAITRQHATADGCWL